MKRTLFVISAILLSGVLAKAQNFPIFSLGESELSSFNPAAIMNDGSEVYIRGSYDWYNTDLYQEKPYNIQVGGNAVGNKWGGVNLQLYFDEYSFFTRHNLQVNYAYQWQFGKDKQHKISAALGMSLGFDYIDMGYLKYDTGNFTGWTPDMNIGIEYCNDKIRAGFGGINLLCTGVKVNGVKVTRNPRMMLTYFMYRFNVKDVVGITPMIYAGYCEKALIEVALRVDYKKIISLSYGFRAMDLRHIAVLNFNIPHTPVSLDLSFTGAEFYYAQSIAAGIRVKL